MASTRTTASSRRSAPPRGSAPLRRSAPARLTSRRRRPRADSRPTSALLSDGLATATDVASIGDLPAAADPSAHRADAPVARLEKPAITALMLLPGALIVLMGFNGGGYFPAAPAVGVIVLAQVLLVRIVRSRRPFEGLAPAV